VGAEQIYSESTIIDYGLEGPCPLRCNLGSDELSKYNDPQGFA